MSEATVRDVVRHWQQKYRLASKGERGKILDLLVETTHCHRKSLVRLLALVDAPEKPSARPGPVSRYKLVGGLLEKLWAISFFACGKRLQPLLPELLPRLVACGEMTVTPFEKELLLSMSPATIDRLLRKRRGETMVHGRSLTKPGTLLRKEIEVRTAADWVENEPGYFEIDLVGHCGGSGEGEFLYSLVMTDVCTGWIALGAMKGKGQQGTVRTLDEACKHVPFAVKGIDSDNGTEFINYHLASYCKQHGIKFTRARPYKKNDQCHVEEKNWTVMRQFLGYHRLETDEELALLKESLGHITRYHNFWSPMMRLVRKERMGSQVKRVYDQACTPFRRLLDREGVLSEGEAQALTSDYEKTNPAQMLREITMLTDRLDAMRRKRERGQCANAV